MSAIWTFKDFIAFYGEYLSGWCGAEYAVHKERYRVQGSGFRVQGTGFRVQGTRYTAFQLSGLRSASLEV